MYVLLQIYTIININGFININNTQNNFRINIVKFTI